MADPMIAMKKQKIPPIPLDLVKWTMYTPIATATISAAPVLIPIRDVFFWENPNDEMMVDWKLESPLQREMVEISVHSRGTKSERLCN